MISYFSHAEEDVYDKDFISTIYETYGKTLWNYAYKLSKDYDVANDIISISFLTIIEKIDLVKNIRSYKTKSYLISIVKNTFLNYKNKEKPYINYDDIKDTIDYNNDNDFTVDYNYSEVEEVLNHMPEPYRSILIYRYLYEELTYEEIAKLLDINVNSIRMYKKRAIDMLKSRIQGGETNND